MSAKFKGSDKIPDLFSVAGLTEHTRPEGVRSESSPQVASLSQKSVANTILPCDGIQDLNDRYLRDTAVAERYSVCRQTVWRWVKLGNLPAPVKLSNGVTRWRLSDLVAHDAVVCTKALDTSSAETIKTGHRE